MRRIAVLLVCTIAVALCVSPAMAQDQDSFAVNYFSNANTASAPDGTFRATNPNSSGGNICVNIFVFDPNQELSECCSCLNTPDGLATLSVNTDLTGNPLTGVTLTTGSIYVDGSVAPPNNVCPFPSKIGSQANVLSWATHIQNSNFAETETPSQGASLSATEFTRLQTECRALQLDGSGHGVCSCGTGD